MADEWQPIALLSPAFKDSHLEVEYSCRHRLSYLPHDEIREECLPHGDHSAFRFRVITPADATNVSVAAVHHPLYYGGEDNPYEVIKVIHEWDLDKDFCLANTVKYVARAGKKDSEQMVTDLEKAAFYLNYRIEILKGERER